VGAAGISLVRLVSGVIVHPKSRSCAVFAFGERRWLLLLGDAFVVACKGHFVVPPIYFFLLLLLLQLLLVQLLLFIAFLPFKLASTSDSVSDSVGIATTVDVAQ
jgi:hypothetical protein